MLALDRGISRSCAGGRERSEGVEEPTYHETLVASTLCSPDRKIFCGGRKMCYCCEHCVAR